MYETYLPLVEYYKKCLNIAKDNGFIWVVFLLSRKADTEALYDKMVSQWSSLDDITGRKILFIFSSNVLKSPTVIGKNKKNMAKGYINSFIKISSNFPSFVMNYGIGKSVPTLRKDLINEHSRTISKMTEYLGLMEKDIPSLVLTNLISNKKIIIKITDKFDCYNFIKLMLEIVEPEIIKYERFIEENSDFLELYSSHLKLTELTLDLNKKSNDYSNEIKESLKSYLETRSKEDFKELKKLINDPKEIKKLRQYNNWYKHLDKKINNDVQYKINKDTIELLINNMDYNIEKLSSELSIDKEALKSVNTSSEFEIVNNICINFKSFIENNGGWRICKDRDEKIVQAVFYCMADSYCQANNLDLSPEVNSGRGQVDFKISYGNSRKVLVEIKLTSNTKLKHGIKTQLPIYLKQEKTNVGIYLIYDNGNPRVVEEFKKYYEQLDEKEKVLYYIIDGTPKLSASQA